MGMEVSKRRADLIRRREQINGEVAEKADRQVGGRVVRFGVWGVAEGNRKKDFGWVDG